MPCQPEPFDEIVFTDHAVQRLHERTGISDLDEARGEISCALLLGHCNFAGGRWFVRTARGEREYVCCRERATGHLVVLTVLTPTVVERSGPPLLPGLRAA